VIEESIIEALMTSNPKIKEAFEKKIISAINKINADALAQTITENLMDDMDWLFEDVDVSKTINECLNEAFKKMFKGVK
jgi:hypothetical protein